MTVYHDEIEIEDFEYDEEEDLYTYPCVSILSGNNLRLDVGDSYFVWKLSLDL